MRRNRGTLINLIVFLIILLSILYINRPASSSPKLFAWTRIQYTTSGTIPPSRGICPGLSSKTANPVLVVARVASETSSWLEDLKALYHICLYTADDIPNPGSRHLQTPANRGHESMAYLTFIIDNYDHLPSAGMVFVHGSRFQWHNDDPAYDNLSLLKQLNVSRALWGPPGPATGYWNLKCDWSSGMCDASHKDARPQGSMETKMRAMLEQGNKRAASDVALVEALRAIFGHDGKEHLPSHGAGNEARLPTTLGRSDAIRSQCCAQFVVARENLRRHTKEEYTALRQWLLDTADEFLIHNNRDNIEVGDQGIQKIRQIPTQNTGTKVHFDTYSKTAPADDLIAGRILSYIWHILFLPTSPTQGFETGMLQTELLDRTEDSFGIELNQLNKLACPRADECYCRLYGRCDLEGCDSPGQCRGQYRVPVGYKLPADWAENHA